ncbi:LysR family transcriptional regulator [Pseudomonas putida]|jgi:DNA-binding transcriptional LysR family regulator|uniref:LysR family transcriptional regulator n=1 Tax=Pseudomonas putida TaxID=303 RepID=UPI00178C9562|nr:LysR substrate-binding domain-containing protein [Pseudomonas putida]
MNISAASPNPKTYSLFKRLKYRHLHMLVTLGNCQNLHRAAETLNMSQPTLTRMLQEVEDAFGCALFERQPRGVVTTPVGEELLKFAHSALNSLDRCVEDLTARAEGGYGHLAVGVVMGSALDRVVSTIATMKSASPHLGIRMMSDTSDLLIEMLEQERLDVAIARLGTPSDRSRFEFEPLGNDRLVMAVRSGHPLATHSPAKMEELIQKWTWLLQPAASPGRKAVERWWADQDLLPPSKTIECSSIWAMLQLVQLTDAVMVLSEAVIHDHVRTGLVTVLKGHVIEGLPPYGIILRKGMVRSRELQGFLSHLHQAAHLKAN